MKKPARFPHTGHSGACALFGLPLAPAKAAPAKADAYLKTLLEPWEGEVAKSAPAEGADGTEELDDWQSALTSGEVVPGSEKAVPHDEEGMAYYPFEGYSEDFDPGLVLGNDSTDSPNDAAIIQDSEGNPLAIQYFRNEEGILMGRVVPLEERSTPLDEPQADGLASSLFLP